MSSVKSEIGHIRKIHANGVDIAYSVTGQGDTTVFLLHGVTANHRVWEPIQKELSKQYHVIAIDQRGHGNSAKPKRGYTAEDYSDDIQSLVQTLSGRGKTVLVGHSLGSRNSIAAAARYPDVIDGIVAIDFTPFIEDEVFDTLENRVNAGDQSFGSIDQIESYLQNRYQLMPQEAVRRRAEYGYQIVGSEYRALADPSAMQQTIVGLRADLGEYMTKLSAPAVIVRGAESVLVTEHAFAKTQALRPDLNYKTVANADHYVPEEQPIKIVSLVNEFIRTL